MKHYKITYINKETGREEYVFDDIQAKSKDRAIGTTFKKTRLKPSDLVKFHIEAIQFNDELTDEIRSCI